MSTLPTLTLCSGGQTGADQGAIFAAKASGIPTGGWAPDAWDTEDGPAPWLAEYGLQMAAGFGYPGRTKLNVEMATAMCWFGNPHSPGGKLTFRLCREEGIATFTVISTTTSADVLVWLEDYVFPGREEVCLMVAGNRESKSPGIARRVEAFLKDVFALLAEKRETY